MTKQIVLKTSNLTIGYNKQPTISAVNFQVEEKSVTSLIGPSGCGKSTLLRTFNRMNDFIDGFYIASGDVSYRDQDIYATGVNPAIVRQKIGMVFQKANPFPTSIFKNICWGPKVNRFKFDPATLVEECLRKAALWDEVKDKLHTSGLSLSGGQQQRLCIARAIAMNPDVILMDEPCSALDPASTSRIEELITQMKENYTILIVTHNMQQAARISDQTAFLYQGALIELGETSQVFKEPKNKLTSDYISGRFG